MITERLQSLINELTAEVHDLVMKDKNCTYGEASHEAYIGRIEFETEGFSTSLSVSKAKAGAFMSTSIICKLSDVIGAKFTKEDIAILQERIADHMAEVHSEKIAKLEAEIKALKDGLA